MSSFLFLITARKGSTRLKNKNILKINKKTLIERTIEFSKKISQKNDKILVSTDSNKIQKIAIKEKVLCPWLRPMKLSGSKVTSEKVILHAIQWYQKKFNKKLDCLILLQPTTPFRNIIHFRKCIKQYKKTKKSIISVRSIYDFFSDIYFVKNKKMQLHKKKNLFVPNGSMYILNVKNFLKFKSIKKMNKFFFLMKSKFNLDIDYEHQYVLAKKIEKINRTKVF
jgi:CMP-N,N'-diacetyllegionaminic acid synthase